MPSQPALPLFRCCSVCGLVLPLSRFGKKGKHNGKQCYRYRCQACCAEYSRRWHQANAEKEREGSRRWHQANAEKEREGSRRWREANAEKRREYKHRRRARRYAAAGSFTEAQFRALCDYYGNVCLACGEPKELTRDHVVPLVDGGSNDITNIQPLCRSCNSSKHVQHTDYREAVPDRAEGANNG